MRSNRILLLGDGLLHLPEPEDGIRPSSFWPRAGAELPEYFGLHASGKSPTAGLKPHPTTARQGLIERAHA